MFKTKLIKHQFSNPVIGLFIVPLISVLSIGQLNAQFSKEVHEIEKVQIIGNYREVYSNDFKKHTIDTSILQNHSTTNLGELLSLTSPVFIKTNGSSGALATPSLRGTTSNHTTVNWNGFPVNSITLGQSDLSLANSRFVDDISITPSAPGSLYGSGTFGGVINLDNKANWSQKNRYSISSEYGSWDHHKFSAAGSIGNKSIKTDVKGFYHQAENNYQYLDDQKRNPTIERRKNNDVLNYGLMNNIYWKPTTRNKIEAGVWYQVKHKSLPSLMGTSGMEENQKDSIFRVYAKWKHVFDNSSLQVKSGYFNHSQLYTKKEQASDDSFMVYSPIKTSKWLNDINYRVYYSDHIKFNAAAQYSRLSAEVDAYNNEIKSSNRLALIGAMKIELGRFSSNLSIRQQFNNETAPKTQYSIGGNYKLIKNTLFVRGNFSTKFRLPTFNEKYWPELGDPDIKPENGYSTEAGLSYVVENKGALQKFTTDLTGYYMKIKNYILWVPENSVYRVKNLNKIFSRGIEFSAKADISLNPFKISWKGTYNLTRSTNIGSDNEYINGKQLRYTPLNRIKQYLQVKYNKYSLSGSWNYTGTRYTTRDHSGFELNPYSIYNLFLSRKLSFNQFSANVQLKIKNLFDKQYQVVSGYPMPGRAYYIKLNVKFNK